MFRVEIHRRLGAFELDVAFASRGEGGVTALFGVSGAGKTAVVDCVAGLARPDSGRIEVGGRVLFDSAAGLDVPTSRRGLGYVFQDSRLFPHLTVRRNLAYGMRRAAPSPRIAFDDVVARLGIGHLLDRRPRALSGGERQRVAVGRALLTDPALLLMDEPLASLDQARKDELLPFLAELPARFGVPILYVSHAVDEILGVADDVVVLGGGRVLATGSVEEVIGRSDAAGSGRSSVLAAVVDGHEDDYGLTRLRVGGALLRVARLDLGDGARVRVQIRAAEVILGRTAPCDLSVQNVLPGTVRALGDAGPSRVWVEVDVGAPLVAEVTRRAAAQLGLAVGEPVVALVKSLSIAPGRITAR
jgi:molybdate transport system ATP-binding protein